MNSSATRHVDDRPVWKRWGYPLLCVVAALAVWGLAANAVQDALLWGAFLFTLWKRRLRSAAWAGPAGVALMLAAFWTVLHVPFSVAPAKSARDFIRLLDVFAVAAAIPALFDRRMKLQTALLASAAALTLILAADLARLYRCLGPAIVTAAHNFKPFLFAHPNNTSMLAGAAALILGWQALVWRERRQPWFAVACALGVAIDLAHIWAAASRGPQLAFGAAVFCVGFMLPGWRAKTTWFVVMIAAGMLAYRHLERINPRFAFKQDLRGFVDRDKVWQHTWRLAQQRPVWGHGFGHRTFQQVYYATNPPLSPHWFPHCHQYWLNLFFGMGWIGVGLYAAAWLLLALGLWKALNRAATVEARAGPAMLLLILIFMMAYGVGDLAEMPATMLLIWLAPASLAAGAQREE
jgi:O-antigen ligase